MANEEEYRDIHEVPQVVPVVEPVEEEEEPFMDPEEEPEEDPEEEPEEDPEEEEEEEAVPEMAADEAGHIEESFEGLNDVLDEVHVVMQALRAQNRELRERNQQLVEQKQELEERNEELESRVQLKEDRIEEIEAYWGAEIEDRHVAESTKAAVESELRSKKRKMDRMHHAYVSSYETFQERMLEFPVERYQTSATISRVTAWQISEQEFRDGLRRGL